MNEINKKKNFSMRIEIPREVHRRFKMLAAAEGKSQKDLFIEMVDAFQSLYEMREEKEANQ